MKLREELVRRTEVEEKLVDTQGELDLMQEEEERHLDDIDGLEKKVKELEKENKDLQNQLDD